MRAQIIVVAQAHGTGSEHELLAPRVDALAPVLAPTSLVTADAGYHSEAACQLLEDRGIDALLADNMMRQRDERFATQGRHQRAPHPLRDKTRTATRPPRRPHPRALRRMTLRTIRSRARVCVPPAHRSIGRAHRGS